MSSSSASREALSRLLEDRLLVTVSAGGEISLSPPCKGTLVLTDGPLACVSGGVLVARGIRTNDEGLICSLSGCGVFKWVSSKGGVLSPIRVLLCGPKKSLLLLAPPSLSSLLEKYARSVTFYLPRGGLQM